MADCVKNFPTQKISVDLSSTLKSNGHVVNVSMPVLGDEYTWSLAGVKKILLKPKLGNVQLAHTTGGPYFEEIPCGGSYETDGIDPSSTTTIYFKSDTAADNMSIEYWT